MDLLTAVHKFQIDLSTEADRFQKDLSALADDLPISLYVDSRGIYRQQSTNFR